MRLFLAFALGLANTSAGLADVKSCQKLYSDAPTSLAGYKLIQGKDLEQSHPGHGYFLSYSDESQDRVSLIFYDGRKRWISKKFAMQHLIESTNAAVATQRRQGLQEGPVNLTDANIQVTGAVGASYIHLSAPRKPPGNDYVLMGVIDNCLYKLRVTLSGEPEKADRKFHKLIQSLGTQLAATL